MEKAEIVGKKAPEAKEIVGEEEADPRAEEELRAITRRVGVVLSVVESKIVEDLPKIALQKITRIERRRSKDDHGGLVLKET